MGNKGEFKAAKKYYRRCFNKIIFKNKKSVTMKYSILLLKDMTVKFFTNKDDMKVAIDSLQNQDKLFECYKKYGDVGWARMEKRLKYE